MASVFVSQVLTPKNMADEIGKAVNSIFAEKLALQQRVKDLNRENQLRSLQLAVHANSEKVWRMTLWT